MSDIALNERLYTQEMLDAATVAYATGVKSGDAYGRVAAILDAAFAAAHPVPAPDVADRTDLARALGLAQAIARAKPYPVEMDGVRAVAGEIVTLLEGIIAAARTVPEDWREAAARIRYERAHDDDSGRVAWLDTAESVRHLYRSEVKEFLEGSAVDGCLG